MTSSALPEERQDPAPCPFCGTTDLLEIEPWHGGGPDKHMISCGNEDCAVNPMVSGETKALAIEAWNRRQSSSAPPPAPVEAVALDIAKWLIQGDRPDEWKLREWAVALDRKSVDKAYDWLCGSAPSSAISSSAPDAGNAGVRANSETSGGPVTGGATDGR